MGVIKRGILGGFSGSVGNVVGSSWKGIATMKAKPLSVANPNSAGQVAQRTKMSNLVAFAKQILTAIIKPLNDRFASGMSGFNLFTQRNIDLFAADKPNPQADLVLSRGNVAGYENLNISADSSTDQAIPVWDDNTGIGNALATDVSFAIAQNRNTGEIVIGIQVARTDVGFSQVFQFNNGMAVGNVIDYWGSFRRADGSQVSDTFYATTVAV